MEPGTRVVLRQDDNTLIIGELYVVFNYMTQCTVIGTDSGGETLFGIFEIDSIEPYSAPQGPAVS